MTTNQAPQGTVLTEFDYLLNAFEAAAQDTLPSAFRYADKRKALFAYVRKLEATQAMTTEEKWSLDADKVWNAMPASLCNDPHVKNLYRIAKSAQPASAPLQDEDAKRIDWMEEHAGVAMTPSLATIFFELDNKYPQSIREAIDAAIQAQEGKQR